MFKFDNHLSVPVGLSLLPATDNTTMQHRWDISISEAKQIQQALASQVHTCDELGLIRTVAGTDVGFENGGKTVRAAIAVLSFPELELVEYRIARQPTLFPYVPGYLSFRECPALLDALAALSSPPDLLLCDGQGIAHPRRLGLASHLGLLTNIPSIGVAKSRLIGTHEAVTDEKGCWQPLFDQGEVIGAVLRSRAGVKPIFVSPGHRISLPTAIHYVMACTTRYRLPETTRWADGIASRRPAIMRQLHLRGFELPSC